MLPLSPYNDPTTYSTSIFILQVGNQELHSDAAMRDPLQELKHIRVDFFHLTRSLQVKWLQVDTQQLKDALPLQFP